MYEDLVDRHGYLMLTATSKERENCFVVFFVNIFTCHSNAFDACWKILDLFFDQGLHTGCILGKHHLKDSSTIF